ncbi:hypothetical protein M758_3G180300 [Ceratodon purpureus]|nr:hypothetical protein M758_3G180300 [Ceratodon purpureus]
MAGPSLSLIHGVQQSNLPLEVMERVLSLLPLPVLCRMRTVCKEWNHIICSSSFHDCYEQTLEERGHGVCFLTRFVSPYPNKKIDRSVRGTTCFLDLEERRWYLIKGSVDQGFETKGVAMSDGLVAEICCPVPPEEGYNHGARTVCCIQMSDPILKMRWRLDPCPNESKLPYLVVVAADRGSRVFRVFAFDNPGYREIGFHRCLWIYESSTNKWRWASQPPRLGSHKIYPKSAVVFQQGLYAIFTAKSSMWRFLMLYDIEKDTWSMVLEDLPAAICEELVVSSGKLFMLFWRSASFCSSSNAMVEMVERWLEMVEIQVSEKTLRSVFQIPASTLSHSCGGQISYYEWSEFTCLALRLNSDSSCSSVVLFSKSSGKVIIYNVVSATVDILPEHPLGKSDALYHEYWASHQNLYVRDILQKDAQSHPPVYMPKEQLI